MRASAVIARRSRSDDEGGHERQCPCPRAFGARPTARAWTGVGGRTTPYRGDDRARLGAEQKPAYRERYDDRLENFAAFFSRALGIRPRLQPLEALTKLFQQSAPSANEIAIHFQAYLQGARLAPATVNRHISTLRSLTKLARMLGLITWMIEIANVRHERRRSTLGPTIAHVRRMLAATSGESEGETRDAAIVTVFFCLGLRVAELCRLDRRDVDLEGHTAWILGKGRREKELVPLPAPVITAIRRDRLSRPRGRAAVPVARQSRQAP